MPNTQTKHRFFVEKISERGVKRYDRKLYNTNNYGKDRPDDYSQQLAQHRTGKWIENTTAVGQQRAFCFGLTIPANEVKWMHPAAVLGQKLGKFPSYMYEEDLVDLCALLEPTFKEAMAKATAIHMEQGNSNSVFRGFFIRSESVSLKDGIHGVGPYKDVRSIVESICTATFAHSPLERDAAKNDQPLTLYLLPWVPTLLTAFELRVFVHQGTVTGMSQQHLYQAHDVWQHLNMADVERFAARVVEHHAECVKSIVTYTDTYTYDLGLLPPPKTPSVAVPSPVTEGVSDDDPNEKERRRQVHNLEDGQLYFIEPNSFGAPYAAGASLFDWKYDEARLLNEEGDVFVRFTVADVTDEY